MHIIIPDCEACVNIEAKALAKLRKYRESKKL
jgi:hypothetical protein